MEVLLAMSIFDICYGIFGLFGKMNIAEKYKGHEWTKNYIKEIAIGNILLGVPWIILYFADKQYDLGYEIAFLLIILFALPSFIYVICVEKKYSKLIKKD